VAAICNLLPHSSAQERLRADLLRQLQPFHEDNLNLSGIARAKHVLLVFLGDEANARRVS
jgi:hypothetical protein